MKRNHWIMGSAIGLAAIAVAIDHTRHRVPAPEPSPPGQQMPQLGEALSGAIEAPCALEAAPCGLGESPCALDISPCSL